MRISDWSSDVCSSDLSGSPERREYMRQLARWSKTKPSNVPDIITFCEDPRYLGLKLSPAQRLILKVIFGLPLDAAALPLFRQISGRTRSEARRVGKEGVHQYRSRWRPLH